MLSLIPPAADTSAPTIIPECTPERVLEIKRTLLEIYGEHSPEKVPKIDRLLGKYKGREEEFLRFVYQKYGKFFHLFKFYLRFSPPSNCQYSICNIMITL